MGRRPLFWQLFPSFILLTVFALLAVTVTTVRTLRTSTLERTADDLRQRALALERTLGEWFPDGGVVERDAACREMGRRLATRITVIDRDGHVLGDSHESSTLMNDHSNRQEFMEAVSAGLGHSERYSHTLKRDMVYVAVITGVGPETPILRLAVPQAAIDDELAELRTRIGLGALLVALLSAVASLLLSRRLSGPLERLRTGAGEFARGRLEGRLPLSSTREIADLATAMNEMAGQLDARIRTVEAQRDELEAVFTGMIEGVLVIDAESRLMSFNSAAGHLLGVDPVRSKGRHLSEAIRQPGLLDFADRVLREGEPLEEDLDLPGEPEALHLQLHGVPLNGGEERPHVLIVLNDVTRLRRLERVRQEFVANVSHELKTPVTSIKGFVETLREGDVDDPDDAKRFLDIIARQTARLDAIIEDLLCLSRLEQGSGETLGTLGVYPLCRPLAAAALNCQMHADARRSTIRVACPDGLQARIDPQLLEQAVVNLIENALKYNDEGTSVRVSAEAVGDVVEIRVADDGRGIEARHLPRLFERFYRVDKARSRQAGGTGLGLAIVKHIVQFHDGSVDVESTPGEGSVFILRLPAEPR
jgi:two-component system phosphate regulon sensor histidine kinase PhoR